METSASSAAAMSGDSVAGRRSLPGRGFKSLTTRLIFWILALGGGVTAATSVVVYRLSREMAVRGAEREAVRATEAAVNQAEEVLRSIEEGTRVLALVLETTSPGAAQIEDLLRAFVAGNPHVHGSAAAFARGAFSPARERFAPYLYRRAAGGTEMAAADLATPTYRYWERDWYLEPTLSRRARWSEPYFDEGGGGVTMVTYSVPVFGPAAEGRPVRAVVTADVDLAWVARLARQVRVGRSGYAMLVSREGRLLAHPELSEAKSSFVNQLDPDVRRRVEPFVGRMLSGGSGFEPLHVPGGAFRLTYARVEPAGWSLGTVYPEKELMEGVTRLEALQATLGMIGLAALAAVVVVLSRRFTAPLRVLAEKTRIMAAGDLDLPLPEVRSRDELGALSAAFDEMRRSLKVHIEELQAATARRERAESELRTARRIQMAMLPKPAAGGPGEDYALAARLVPARAIGGDLYDHFVRDGKVYFLVADVSGKGVPAALFMARAKALFEAAAAYEAEPATILLHLNQGLCRENEEGMFVTAVCGILDGGTGELALAVAGHDPPLRAGAGRSPRPLNVDGGPVLGLMPDAAFPTSRFRLSQGEEVVLFTDGVTDARDPGDAMFGQERLQEAVGSAASEGADAVTAAVLRLVEGFAAGAAQADDITILTLQHRPPARA
jgi:sigma-B regulation protein RsbU (phosphoserine phosphatase)